jgi:hypothetical protein
MGLAEMAGGRRRLQARHDEDSEKMNTRKAGGWLSIFGRDRNAPLAAPASDTMGNLPTPITARDLNRLLKQEAAAAQRSRLIFAIDTTASRQSAWEAAKQLQDELLVALPGDLDVALAAHGGNRVTLFSEFTSNVNELRDFAAGVRCEAGLTRMCDILDRTAKLRPAPSVVLYIGDDFEESRGRARRLADALLLQGTRVIILHDRSGNVPSNRPIQPGIFREIAERTGGAVLPFDISALSELRGLLQAVAVLAVGDTELLEEKRQTMPAAGLLLEHLGRKRIGG